MSRIRQGVDIVNVQKLRGICMRHKEFMDDVFTPAELKCCMKRAKPYQHLAGRFAAKEACLKALGRGIRAQGVDHALREVEVSEPGPGARAELRLSGHVMSLAQRMGFSNNGASVSISATEQYAVSTVMLVRHGVT